MSDLTNDAAQPDADMDMIDDESASPSIIMTNSPSRSAVTRPIAPRKC